MRYAIFLWLALLLVLTGCEVLGFVGQTQAQALAFQKCNEFRLKQIQDPQVLTTEWLTVAQVEARGLSLAGHAPNELVWLVTLRGQWQLEGGPPPPEQGPAPPAPILHRCMAVVGARTGESLSVRAEP
ncbi:MAG: hypothetical protein IT331_12705 [Anaerolineae bacterium]|nr:hypothetical protein [Anaerolineae bacterium]